ncbi:RNAse (barnase) inhibitor barstar [Catenulispora sp. EB89]|uniref:barstar family protein n=1 Tax=Catenulispora sp. EB89 TaxID=3156257 RepID=UPI0035126FE6
MDVTLLDAVADPPHDWYDGAPAVPGTWARHDPAGRMEWLMLALANVGHQAVTNIRGLHCALGEALRGPGHYYGWGLDALDDCLGGGFGVRPPFTLVWQGSAKVRQALAADRVGDLDGAAYFDLLVRILERNNVTVVLA